MTVTEPVEKVLTLKNMNPLIKSVEYAVRGRLAIRAEEIRTDMEKGKGDKYDFDRVVNCNIGNPQQLNQKPITFFRQVSSLCDNPDLLKKENRSLISQLYPLDAIERAELLLKSIGSVGAYSHSQGVPFIRNTVAQFIERRDGFEADPNHIYLTQGASSGVQTLLNILTENKNTGIMIPIPQYPLYSATLSLYGATPVPYYLDESTGWSLDIQQLEQVVIDARKQGTDVRALVIINPGNPTGQCLTGENMCDIVSFCYQHRLVLLADEVYQTNIYQSHERPFVSFKKALMDHPNPEVKQGVELVSFHSISKGMVGECGRRGGYFECVNIDKEVMEQLYKMTSVSLCPNLHGQILVDLMCNPPKSGDASYESYTEEIDAIYVSLKRRSKKLEECFNSLEGVSCQPAQGSMYLFPSITLPERSIEAAKKLNMAPDAYYSHAMLEATGVCVVPGSGFGQKEGTWHFRSTFLPEEHLFDNFCSALKKFHNQFLEDHKD
ncbi:pyridoxal phosphate-dependent transferase [Cokeromyces recurvatus]|uniref:pyridoxal phosphate-dependent transferase n=1 Tax=Cokeromyces recurvatus TaxID=90255 RepID=UPI00221ED6DA|nr:pyridoxal phosphate-dependent transferase [Cokeromyces recurvatus]KAI7901296.1 pyridoxal phosphate-dependent transferase [Cokeromyces recurvatus]